MANEEESLFATMKKAIKAEIAKIDEITDTKIKLAVLSLGIKLSQVELKMTEDGAGGRIQDDEEPIGEEESGQE